MLLVIVIESDKAKRYDSTDWREETRQKDIARQIQSIPEIHNAGGIVTVIEPTET